MLGGSSSHSSPAWDLDANVSGEATILWHRSKTNVRLAERPIHLMPSKARLSIDI
jgi:hypothetical protein